MALKNTGPQLPIPTGYEGQMSEIARKKRLAEMLGQRAMGDHAPFRSWTEVLAQLGQAFFARKSEKKAASMEGDLRQQQMSDATQAQQAFGMDLDTGASNEDMVRKYANNPWVGTQMEPLLNAWAEKRKAQDKWLAPEKMLGPDGKTVTTQRNEIGQIRQAPDGYQAMPNIQNVNDVGVNFDQLRGGEILPQQADAVAIRGPDGTIVPNPAAIQAKSTIANAGAPRAADTKIVVNNADEGMKGAMKILEGTQTAAASAAKKILIVGDIKKAMATGKVSLGPGATAGMVLRRIFGGDPGKLAQTRTVLQSSARLVLANRKALEGQGAVSNYESEIAQKAETDGIDSLSAPELGVMLGLTEKMSNYDMARHQETLNRMKDIPGLAPYLSAFQVNNPMAPPKAPAKPKYSDPVLDEVMRGR